MHELGGLLWSLLCLPASARQICVGKTYTACGTPDYFAPELIASTGCGLKVASYHIISPREYIYILVPPQRSHERGGLVDAGHLSLRAPQCWPRLPHVCERPVVFLRRVGSEEAGAKTHIGVTTGTRARENEHHDRLSPAPSQSRCMGDPLTGGRRGHGLNGTVYRSHRCYIRKICKTDVTALRALRSLRL